MYYPSISRDPFARTELQRMVVKPLAGSANCEWCGNKNGHGHLFRYRTASDGGSTGLWSRQFCSIGCCRSYNT